jgi:hypothetical protein
LESADAFGHHRYPGPASEELFALVLADEERIGWHSTPIMSIFSNVIFYKVYYIKYKKIALRP